MAEYDLETQFSLLQKYYEQAVGDEFSTNSTTIPYNESETIKTIEQCDLCIKYIDKIGIFSSNEELDDIPTLNLKVISFSISIFSIN